MHASDLRGMSRLVVDATTEVTTLVESVHQTVLELPFLRSHPLHVPVEAITRLVYRSVRGLTRAAGSAVDGLLGAFAPLFGEAPPAAGRDAILAVLNGVIGDHLAATDNPLALPMCVRLDGTALSDSTTRRIAGPRPGGKLMLLVHGLCTGPAVWARGGQDRASACARALGYTPLHLQYNSGLHVSVNGRALADLLEELVHAWPVPVEELAIVGHSMGGLVARSALHYGSLGSRVWRDVRITLVFLGTPHHGAPLERHGHGLERLLALSGVTAAFARVGRMRSAGITDLRHGNVLDEDWDGHCRFAHAHDTRSFVPLPPDVRGFAIAGSLGHRSIRGSTRLLGDGLVPVASALGHHDEPSRRLSLPPSHQWVARGTRHVDLVSDPAVFRKIRTWLRPAEFPTTDDPWR
jgi:hypothetical protein